MAIEYRNDTLCLDKLDISGNIIENIQDPEGRTEIKTDSEGKILSYRDSQGVMHENVGIESATINTNSLNLTEQGMTEFQKDLINSGFSIKNIMDWSDIKNVQIPLPRGLARANIICDAIPTSKSEKYKATLEFWDMDGNYFKKPIKKFTIQGNSSAKYKIKNFGFDFDDGYFPLMEFDYDKGKKYYQKNEDGSYTELSKGTPYFDGMYEKTAPEIKFGHWVSQDSFHLKAFYIDVFVGLGNIQYNYIEYLYRNMGCRPSRKAFDDSEISINNSTGNLRQDFGTGAMCHPEGFPFELYINGKYYALYAFNLKKHRDNYLMKKDDYTSIMIDGWTNDPSDVNKNFWKGEHYIPWTGGSRNLELKNPKIMICMDGSEYDDDSPKELIDETSEYWDATNKYMANTLITKNILITMSNNWKHTQDLVDEANAIEDAEQKAAKLAEAKAFLATFYDIDGAIFHYIFGQIVGNSEGMYGSNTQWMIYNGQWMVPTLYDLDCGFGRHGYGVQAGGIGTIFGNITPYKLLRELYADEIKNFYVNGRNHNFISVDRFMGFFDDYIEKVGYDAYKRNIDMRKSFHFDIPSYRSNQMNSEYWDISGIAATEEYSENTQYNVGDRCTYGTNPQLHFVCIKACQAEGEEKQPPFERYEYMPYEWGFYESPKRIRKWLEARFEYLDNYFNYNN